MGSIPGRGTKMLHATTKKKKSFPGIPFNSDEGKRSQGTKCPALDCTVPTSLLPEL